MFRSDDPGTRLQKRTAMQLRMSECQDRSHRKSPQRKGQRETLRKSHSWILFIRRNLAQDGASSLMGGVN